MRSIRDLPISGRRLFLRVDFNVPLDGGRVSDDTRIVETVPTIRLAIEAGARTICASHLGKAKGQRKPALSLAPVAVRFAETHRLLEGDGAVRVERQHREDGALFRASELEHPAPVEHLERSENADIHGRLPEPTLAPLLRFSQAFTGRLPALCLVVDIDREAEMFGKYHIVKLVGSVAAALAIAVVGARTAKAQTFITDTLGGNGHPQPAVVQGYRLITDTLGGNGRAYNPRAYVPGGSSQQLSQAIQSVGKSPVPSPAPVQTVTDSSFSWSHAWIGGFGAAGLLLLAGAAVMRTRQRRPAMA